MYSTSPYPLLSGGKIVKLSALSAPLHEIEPPNCAVPGSLAHAVTTTTGASSQLPVPGGLSAVGTHGLGDALGLDDSVGLGDALALAVGVDATVGGAASESVGRAVGGVTAVDPQAASPAAAIAVLMMALSFMAAAWSTGALHPRLRPRQLRRTLASYAKTNDLSPDRPGARQRARGHAENGADRLLGVTAERPATGHSAHQRAPVSDHTTYDDR